MPHPRERIAVGRADLLLVAALLLLGQVEVELRGTVGDATFAHALWAASALLFLWRRAHPLLVYGGTLGVLVLAWSFDLSPLGGATQGVVGPLALFGLGAYVRDPRRAVAAAALGFAGIVLVRGVCDRLGLSDARMAVEWIRYGGILLPGAVGGVVLRDRTETLRAARARERAAAAREQTQVELALAVERTRIARELHAVVTSCVRSVLDEVQTLRSPLTRGAPAARAALARARAASQAALAEMRRMLTLLRADGAAVGAADGAAPPPADAAPALLRRIPAPLRAQGLALLVLAVELGEALLYDARYAADVGAAGVPARIAGAVAMALVFVPRRRWPLLTVGGVIALANVRFGVVDDGFALDLPFYLAAFVAGAYVRPLALALLCAVATAIGGIVPIILMFDLDWETYPPSAYLFFGTMVAAAWITGVASRRRLAQADELRALTAAEERRRAHEVELALAAERLRVACELHDLVGHGLATITLQSAAAGHLLDSRPHEAAAAIDAVEQATGSTLRELEELLAALDGSSAGGSPSSPERIEQLVEAARRSGMAVELVVAGTLAEVPPGPAAAAYRIVQESLTNARKHGAPGGRVQVRVGCDEAAVALEVRSALAARGGAGATADGGFGLLGMRERVRLYGGALDAGPDGDGDWVVRARLSLPAADAPPPAVRAAAGAAAR